LELQFYFCYWLQGFVRVRRTGVQLTAGHVMHAYHFQETVFGVHFCRMRLILIQADVEIAAVQMD